MAKPNNRDQPLKTQLIAELETQRRALAVHAGALDTSVRNKIRQSTDLPSLCRQSISRHPIAWASATAITAFVATRIVVGQRPSQREKSASHARGSALTISALFGFLGKSAIKALRPAVEKAIRERIAASFSPPADNSLNP